jgi:hypothetical protein
MRSPSRWAIGAMLGISLACASGGAARSGARVDVALITREQIVAYQFRNAYDAVQALHSQWLSTRGTDSFSNPTQVWVYLDDTRLGGIETLRHIATSSIAYIRHFDGLAATARWGLDHGQGVIYVSTRS